MKDKHIAFVRWEGNAISKTFGTLFGTPSKSYQSSSSQTPTGYGSLSPEAQKTYSTALQNAGGLTAQNFAPAATTPEQLQAAQYFGTPIETITPEQFQAGLSTYTNPFESQVLQNTIGDLNTQAQGGYRDIASLASDAGGFGSNRRGLLESELQKNLLKTVGDISASSRASNFENAAARTMADIGQTRTMNQQNMGSLFDIGSQFQNANTATANAPAQLQQYLANLSAMLAGGGSTSSSSGVSTGETKGILNSDIGKAASAAALMAMSDVRSKEQIVYQGTKNGFNVYDFNYIGQQGRFRGVMAQEVEKVMPDAIHEINGIKHVDYSKLGFAMEVVHV